MTKENSEKTKKIKKIPSGRGRLCIHSSFNNLTITITQENGDKLAQISSRTATGYRGTAKSTSFAAQKAAEAALAKLTEFGISVVEIIVWGIGNGRDAVLNKFKGFCNTTGLQVERIIDNTALAFNGCRPRKRPRK